MTNLVKTLEKMTPFQKVRCILENETSIHRHCKSDYKYLCYTINGTCDSTGQCAITCEYARELLKYSEKDMNTIIEVMCSEHITELQGGMIVL